ncbi:hypothetical protein BV509_20575 [Rhodovulum sulfidophilum]|uniref:Uncharacterized protein n=1 Tax=Rhodovulum visakhapatnamense TaxID=364297 RepID=A0ABS1RP43_9RHOB|nr:hypothetical protein [Rhodovulum visakhapatnamense]MBL3571805.1 hypothetical protein [Rhodovulum visakhapatnamense]MBL3580426.1 hypothetical protein [Rhodovulum visakhapatnamense]OLS46510.1 hypothetical protein BV509_20575 [Rhodovulum sulfidophilum]
MQTIEHLLRLADAYKQAASIAEDTTVSYRVFGDTKKLAALRAGGDITTRRYRAAIAWFEDNWPNGSHPAPTPTGDAA